MKRDLPTEDNGLAEVTVEPGGRVIRVRRGTTLAAAAGLAGLEVELALRRQGQVREVCRRSGRRS